MPVDTDEPDVHSGPRRHRVLITLAVVVVLFGCGALVVLHSGAATTVAAWFDGHRGRDYPDIDTTTLDPVQQRIVEVTRTEFDAQPDGTKYSEGVDEAWCADFVSWVMNQSGRTLVNPNSGSWRIPGVATLTEYFQSEKHFHAADSGYRPELGDVMLYSSESRFGQHTNIVLRVDGDVVTTVGGNELGGNVRISEFTIGDDDGLVGFGSL
ncbi:CHAP domain-containing protein [Gordonia sp. MP11Mi]|uniref:Peptidase C51 domain-containing protein n=1 Tax=Gordonia sp. MP11Mi TaxID=3022769 RepID=A0AA97CWE1_9ACTN